MKTPGNLGSIRSDVLSQGMMQWYPHSSVNIYIGGVFVTNTMQPTFTVPFGRVPIGDQTVTAKLAAHPFIQATNTVHIGSHLADEEEYTLAGCDGSASHAPGIHTNETTNSPCICGHQADAPKIRFGFDHNKVNTRNLTHPDENRPDSLCKHCLGVTWRAGGQIDLMSLVPADMQEYANLVLWKIDGEVQESSHVDFFTEPEDLYPLILRVQIVSKENHEVWDSLCLVVLASKTRTWYNVWKAHWLNPYTGEWWLEELPAAYTQLATSLNGERRLNPEPATSQLWEGISSPGKFYHHTSVYEMRSAETIGNHGHQACYDENGILVQSGVSAGTADLWHHSYWRRKGPSHKEADVHPFIRALQLDGNPVKPEFGGVQLSRPLMRQGSEIANYLLARPPIPNSKPLLEPGEIP